MQERRYDGSDVFSLLSADLDEQARQIEKAIADPRNEAVTVHKTEASLREAESRVNRRKRKDKRKRQRAARRRNR